MTIEVAYAVFFIMFILIRDFSDVDDTQQTQNICMTFAQRRPNVFDVGPTLYKYHTNVLSLFI